MWLALFKEGMISLIFLGIHLTGYTNIKDKKEMGYHRRATRGGRGRGGEASTALSWKLKKNDLTLRKNALIGSCRGFYIENVIWRVPRRKKAKIFRCGAFFSGPFDEVFIEVP